MAEVRSTLKNQSPRIHIDVGVQAEWSPEGFLMWWRVSKSAGDMKCRWEEFESNASLLYIHTLTILEIEVLFLILGGSYSGGGEL